MRNFFTTTRLILLLTLAGTLFSATPGYCLPGGKSCLAAWSEDTCGQAYAEAALLPKAVDCPNCHRDPGLPLPLRQGSDLLNPNQRLDQTGFVTLQKPPATAGRRQPPPLVLFPRRPHLPNQTLAALRTVVLRH